jgi:phage tail-like protein
MPTSLASIFPLGLNAGFVPGSNALGARLDPYQGFNFLIEIEGLLTGGFTEVNGLESEIELEERREGGRNDYVQQLPGPARYPSRLVLKHGLTDLDTLWNWYKATTRGVIQRKNGTIMLLDRQRLPAMWWNFKQAFPVKWSGPQLNAGSNEFAFETIELVHRGITKPTLSQLTALGRGGAGLGGAL